MPLTHGSMVYQCDLDTARLVAECDNLRLLSAPIDTWNASNNPPFVEKELATRRVFYSEFYAWEDQQTGGGGCRITWYKGIAWISSHSGYAWADTTQAVSELMLEVGAIPMDDMYASNNPRIYGVGDYDDRMQHTTEFLSYYNHEGD